MFPKNIKTLTTMIKMWRRIFFRYDREVIKKDPPKKNLVHFHAVKDYPHYNSEFIRLQDVIKFLENNWDLSKF